MRSWAKSPSQIPSGHRRTTSTGFTEWACLPHLYAPRDADTVSHLPGRELSSRGNGFDGEGRKTERVGFEPTVGLPPQHLSRVPLSTAQSPLHALDGKSPMPGFTQQPGGCQRTLSIRSKQSTRRTGRCQAKDSSSGKVESSPKGQFARIHRM